MIVQDSQITTEDVRLSGCAAAPSAPRGWPWLLALAALFGRRPGRGRAH